MPSGSWKVAYPSAPRLPLRRAQKYNTRFQEAAVLGVDVVHTQVNHYSVGFCGLAVNTVVQTQIQPHVSEAEDNEIPVVRVQRQTEGVSVEGPQGIKVGSP